MHAISRAEVELKRGMMKKFILLLGLVLSIGLSNTNAGAINPDNQNNNSIGIIDEDFQQNTLTTKVFPNPVTTNKFHVSSQKNIGTIRLSNILGQQTEINSLKKNPGLIEVTLKNRKQGIYLVTIIFEDKSKEVKRIIVN